MKYHRTGDRGEKVKGNKSAGIIFTDGRAVLLLKRAGDCSHSGTWAFPGGHARQGETEIGNAVRETMEETGLKSIPGHRFDSLSNLDGHKRFTAFLYRVPSQFSDLSLSDEHSDWEWVEFDQLGGLDLHPKLKENLPRYLKAIRRKITSFNEWCGLTNALNLIDNTQTS